MSLALEDAVRDAKLMGDGADATRAYALRNMDKIKSCMKKYNLEEYPSWDIMMNGKYLLEFYAEDADKYMIVGVGASNEANFGGEGIHFRTVPICKT
jgi:hypothetical protein